MTKISARFYLLASLIALVFTGILHEQFSLEPVRLFSICWISSLFAIPAIILLNGLFTAVRSLKLSLSFRWIILIFSIMTISHVVISLLLAGNVVGPYMTELIWLVMNSSMMLTLLFQFSTINHLIKRDHETRKSFTIH